MGDSHRGGSAFAEAAGLPCGVGTAELAHKDHPGQLSLAPKLMSHERIFSYASGNRWNSHPGHQALPTSRTPSRGSISAHTSKPLLSHLLFRRNVRRHAVHPL